MNKPYLLINIEKMAALNAYSIETRKISDWLDKIKPESLNMAGNRESYLPGMYKRVIDLLQAVKDILH